MQTTIAIAVLGAGAALITTVWRAMNPDKSKWFNRVSYALVLLGVFMVGWGIYHAANDPIVVQTTAADPCANRIRDAHLENITVIAGSKGVDVDNSCGADIRNVKAYGPKGLTGVSARGAINPKINGAETHVLTAPKKP
jgi:hypothetical protein